MKRNMKKNRKLLSILLALVMLLSLVPMSAMATADGGEPESTPAVETQAAEETASETGEAAQVPAPAEEQTSSSSDEDVPAPAEDETSDTRQESENASGADEETDTEETGSEPAEEATEETVVVPEELGDSLEAPSETDTHKVIIHNLTDQSKGTVVIDKTDNVAAGETVTVTVTPNTGYIIKELIVERFTDNARIPTVRIDGKYTFTMPDCNATVYVQFGTGITDIEISGLVAPVAGATPITYDALSVPSGAKYHVSNLSWHKNGGMDSFTTFEEGNYYLCNIWVTADDGMKFSTVSGIEQFSSVTINSGEFEIVKDKSGLLSDSIVSLKVVWPVIPTSYPVWVGSTQVTSANKDDILGDGTAKYTPGDGSGTLTFTTATPNITGTHASGALIYADGIDLTIDALSGLTLNNANYCIYVDSITINGNVNLTSSDNAAIYSRAGNVSIGGAAMIISKGFCIDAEGNVSIDGNADLTSSNGMAVCSRGENGTKITGNLTARANHMHVIDAYKGDVQIGGNADLENTYSDGFGIFAGEGNVSIGGDATITSENARINAGGGISIGGNADLTSGKGFALYSMGAAGITITGNLTASANHVHGILASKGDIQIGGNAKVKNTNSSGRGITASEGKVIMTSGKWDITSGAYDAIFAKSGIEIPSTHEITTPTGGKITQVGGIYTVTESDGMTVAAHAVIEPKVEKYPVWVGGVQVTSANKDDILGDGGKAKFDPDTKTLTLDNPTISGTHENAVIYAEGIDLTVKGAADISGSYTHGIWVKKGNLIVNGNITAKMITAGFYTDQSIIIEGGTITVEGGPETAADAGLFAYGDITINGGTVNAGRGDYGIYSAGTGTVIINGGNVHAYAHSIAIYSKGSVTVSGGTVETEGESCGIVAGGNITISGDMVTATGGNYGIRTYNGDVTISGSSTQVTATAGTDLGTTAIYSDSGNITISGGTVKSEAGEGGILAYKGTVSIQDGTARVEADGGTVAVRGQSGITIGDGLMIKEPVGGTVEVISSGSANIMDGSDVARHALIVPKVPAYTVTVSDDGNGTGSASPFSGLMTGTEVELAFTPNSGYQFKEWQVVSGGVTITGNKFTIGTEDVEVKAIFEKIQDAGEKPVEVSYGFVSGDGSTWTKGSAAAAEFVVKRNVEDGLTFGLFKGIQIDGSEVAAANYDAVSGSVELSVKAAFLETLSEGEHTILAEFEDGTAEAKFTVAAAANDPEITKPADGEEDEPKKDDTEKGDTKKDGEKQPDKNPDGSAENTKAPKTGDETNTALWIMLMLASMLALSGTVFTRKKKTGK